MRTRAKTYYQAHVYKTTWKETVLEMGRHIVNFIIGIISAIAIVGVFVGAGFAEDGEFLTGCIIIGICMLWLGGVVYAYNGFSGLD